MGGSPWGEGGGGGRGWGNGGRTSVRGQGREPHECSAYMCSDPWPWTPPVDSIGWGE